jgi:hypothetical protein
MTSEPVDVQARRLFKAARRGEHVWPLTVVVALLYVLSTCWSVTRTLGGAGPLVTVHAHPTIGVPVGLVALAVASQVLARIAEEAGASPFWWPRQVRRVLVGLAFGLPVLLTAAQPALVLMQIDAGSAQPAPIAGWLIGLSASTGP